MAENGYLPDIFVRRAIHSRFLGVLAEHERPTLTQELEDKMKYIEQSKQRNKIAFQTDKANKQHYELPTEFFQIIMGKYMKYSCCWFEPNTKTIDEAEANMLNKYLEYAEIGDGMEIFDLGCGWGAFTLFAAAKFPKSKFTALSNSKTQREYIEQRAKERGLTNITVITCDINDFSIDKTFDRVISIEFFEHMKNYELLFQRISTWLKPNGKLFVHVFCHIKYAYDFKDGEWMTDHFFSGGTMPSDDLFLYFQKDIQLVNHWRVPGVHYSKTSEAWLANMDKKENYTKIREIFSKTYPPGQVDRWINIWRLFFLAVSEMFYLDNGKQFLVSFYLFEKRK